MSGAATASRRLLIAALGVASLTALMYVLVERRRRKGRGSRASATLYDTAQLGADASTHERDSANATAAEGSPRADAPQPRVDTPPSSHEARGSSSPPLERADALTPTTAAPAAVSIAVEQATSADASGLNTVKAVKEELVELSMATSENDAKPVDDSSQKEAASAPSIMANGGYKNAESPSGTSTHSEGSADSGRATAGPNCSPFDNHSPEHNAKAFYIYEFEVPNTLVGLIIGVQGKTISELSKRAEVRILIRPHHTHSRMHTHQLCSIEGHRSNINKCLHMIRYRFPQNRFPDLNLKPALPQSLVDCKGPVVANEPTTLSLPIGAPSEAFICNIVDPGHFFVQLPTHPTFSSLVNLDYYTANIYRNAASIPTLPKPCAPGVVCIAPTANGWFRAITMDYVEADDTVIVRLADHGGFLQLPRSDLRQIRSDLTSLPMQAIECYLAHAQPIEGTVRWSEAAKQCFAKQCASGIVQVELVGYHKDNQIPIVEVFATDENKQVRRIDTVLRERGYAKPADPSRMILASPNVKN